MLSTPEFSPSFPSFHEKERDLTDCLDSLKNNRHHQGALEASSESKQRRSPGAAKTALLSNAKAPSPRKKTQSKDSIGSMSRSLFFSKKKDAVPRVDSEIGYPRVTSCTFSSDSRGMSNASQSGRVLSQRNTPPVAVQRFHWMPGSTDEHIFI